MLRKPHHFSHPYQPPTSNIYYNSGKVNLSALPEFFGFGGT
nr:MAG TPA: hypothetical protein [Caudoviricetes sp.]